MSRVLKDKILENTRLVTNYGGWIYCDNCNQNIGYLCYSTYDSIEMKYKCNCGSNGSIIINFEDSQKSENCNDELIIIKNRFCCPKDNSPLLTILSNKVTDYEVNISCKSCEKNYRLKK